MPRKSKRRSWTSSDVRTLKTMARRKTGAASIARSLKRTEGATRQKAFSLGLAAGSTSAVTVLPAMPPAFWLGARDLACLWSLPAATYRPFRSSFPTSEFPRLPQASAAPWRRSPDVGAALGFAGDG